MNSTNLPIITFAKFADSTARSKSKHGLTFAGLYDKLLNAPTQNAKGSSPWVKLATFGDKRSASGCLRHDANVLDVTGIEIDYDGGVMPFAEAKQKLEAAGIKAILCSSWSHVPARTGEFDEKGEPIGPRWRVLAPTSKPLPPNERARLVARINGVLGGVIADESFTLSQSYYYGRCADRLDTYECAVTFDDTEEGEQIDLLDGLDALAIGKGPSVSRPVAANDAGVAPTLGKMPPDLVADIRRALSYINPDAACASFTYAPYSTWLNVGLALHATGGGQQAKALWDEWTKANSACYEPKELTSKWWSFDRSEYAGPKIGVGTLFAMAKVGGFQQNAAPILAATKVVEIGKGRELPVVAPTLPELGRCPRA